MFKGDFLEGWLGRVAWRDPILVVGGDVGGRFVGECK